MTSRKGPKSIGERLYDARVEAGMTQDDAAYAARRILPKSRKPSGSTISRIESGFIEEPDLALVVALVLVYGKTLEQVVPEYVDEARAIWRLVASPAIDLTECAPWELNPQPAENRSGVVEVWVQPQFDFNVFHLPVVDVDDTESVSVRHLARVS